ncbi:MAG: phosphoribosylformylglycinamidine synthase subunit PurQ [Hyphomonadaceae bacterium]
MKSAVIVFPGSNCDRDAATALERVTGVAADMIWHKEPHLPIGCDLVVLPGGFSYGDYLRCGAMAARSPVMAAVAAHAERGGYVLGICNGFQILTEAGLLPGALTRNASLHYACKDVGLEIANANSPFTRAYGEGRETTMPIGHGEGRYVADEETLDRLEGEGRVIFRYRANPNGSMRDIAGIASAHGNVLGLMPHPDRSADPALGRTGGWNVWKSVAEAAG